MKTAILILSLLFFDNQSTEMQTVIYDRIELNTFLKENKEIVFKQFVFWKDGYSQGYVIITKPDFICGPVKYGPYHEVIVKHKNIYYRLKSKNLTFSETQYDVETQDLKMFKRNRPYNVRLW